MSFRLEAGARRDGADPFGEALLDSTRRIEVLDGPASDTHEVVVVAAGEFLREFEPRVLVPSDDTPDDAGLFQDGEVAVGGALCQPSVRTDQLGGRHRSLRVSQRVDQGAATGRVALEDPAEANGGEDVEIVGHKISVAHSFRNCSGNRSRYILAE